MNVDVCDIDEPGNITVSKSKLISTVVERAKNLQAIQIGRLQIHDSSVTNTVLNNSIGSCDMVIG